jgi:hypothetical protein
MAEKDLHCLSRYRTGRGKWERQLLSCLCWAGHRLSSWSDGALFPVKRPGSKFTQPGLTRGAILYGWLPDLERIWPTVFPPAESPAEPTSPRPGSADAWIEELFPNDWRLFTPKTVHNQVVKEVETRNKDAQKRDKNAPQLQAPSLTAFRAALKSRRQKPSARKTRKTQLRF